MKIRRTQIRTSNRIEINFLLPLTIRLNKSLANIPDKLSDWNIETIERLLSILSIEGETFDFKGDILKPNYELYNDFCAMSNSLGGFLVLGINERKAPNGHLICFEKEGFVAGKEDKINQTISNNLHIVEPTPLVESKLVYDQNLTRFYPIIKITSVDINKPYITKNRGQCYIRIGNTNQIATRSIILNLQRDLREMKSNIQKLKVVSEFFKQSFMLTISELKDIDPDGIEKISLLDLQTLKGALIALKDF